MVMNSVNFSARVKELFEGGVANQDNIIIMVRDENQTRYLSSVGARFTDPGRCIKLEASGDSENALSLRHMARAVRVANLFDVTKDMPVEVSGLGDTRAVESVSLGEDGSILIAVSANG